MKVSLLLVFLVLTGFNLFGQDTLPENQLHIQRHSLYPWTEKQLSLRVGVGFQRSFYGDFGVAIHSCTYSDVGFFSNDFYTALEWTPTSNHPVFGLKIGYEANAYLVNVGLEVKYQTNFMSADFVITPKIGLGLFGDLNLFYGYNISTNRSPFSQIGPHQFSLVLNLNNHFLQYL